MMLKHGFHGTTWASSLAEPVVQSIAATVLILKWKMTITMMEHAVAIIVVNGCIRMTRHAPILPIDAEYTESGFKTDGRLLSC